MKNTFKSEYCLTSIIIILFINIRLNAYNSVECQTDYTYAYKSLALNASNYLNLLAKVSANPTQTSHSSNQLSTNSLPQNVRQFRHYLRGEDEPTDQCQQTVRFFGQILAELIQCVLINENPFTICLNCSQEYSDVYSAYTDLTNHSISNCSESFINSEKIDLINGFYTNSISEWIEGNCDSCFSGDKQNLQINNDTEYYFQLTNNYMLCLTNETSMNATNNSCIACKQSFDWLNGYYESIELNYSSRVCNDIIDSMKDIRKHWSQSLDCPINSDKSYHFLILVLVVAVLPLVLYFTGRLFFVNRNKTLMKQKRLSTYHLGSSESAPLIQH